MRAVKYYVDNDMYIENRDPEKSFSLNSSWAVVYRSACINKDGELEYEPMPSSRDEGFYKRCRFTLEEAEKIAKAYLRKK